ncbi:MAG: hypothetical protein ABSD48_15925 [Armatimonadota bacterium]|jgi:hypothetical protein
MPIKWGDWDQIDVGLLERTNAVLFKQQAVAGGEAHCPDFSPGKIIMDNSATKGMSIMQTIGPIISHGSIAINNFMLGYLYCLAAQGHLAEIFAELDAETEIGGAHHDEADGT